MDSLSSICGVNRRSALSRIIGSLFLVPLMARLHAQPGSIERRPVKSSVLAAVGYDAARRLLEIEFHSGAIYRYLGVPEETYTQLLAAESKGHFFGAAIRDKFRCERVKPRTAK